MNTTHSPITTARPQSPPTLAATLSQLPERTPRTGLPARSAMRIGLRLLLWGSRPRRGRQPITHEEALLVREEEQRLRERERRLALMIILTRGPIR